MTATQMRAACYPITRPPHLSGHKAADTGHDPKETDCLIILLIDIYMLGSPAAQRLQSTIAWPLSVCSKTW